MARNFKILIILSLVLYLADISLSANPRPVDSYPNEVLLQGPDLYYLYWKHDNTDVTFEIHYKNTAKWIMFGFDSSTYSDVVVAWMNEDKETGHFSNRKLTSANQLVTKKNDNWNVLNAFVKDDYNVLIFSRKIKLICDGKTPNDDVDIQPGSVNTVVFGFGQSFNSVEGSIGDFKNALRSANFNALRQSNGPFNCAPIPKKPIFTSNPTSYYSNYVDLVEGIYRFYWNFTSTDLTGEIHVKTNGWVGFGLSPNGGMDKSDVVVGWINSDGSVNFTDRHISNRNVIIDKNQNWKLLQSARSNGYIIFKFNRPLVLCDSDDRTIEDGSPFLIYAYGNVAPSAGSDITYHEANRGVKTTNIISMPTAKILSIPNEEKIEFSLSNVIVPAVDTFYYMNIYKVPDTLTEKRHILKWEIVLPEVNTPNIHHMLVYECVKTLTDATASQFQPGDANKIPIRGDCIKITHGWAVGGETINYFPKDTGYPIGGNTEYKYFLIEIHYDNPEMKIGYIENVKLIFSMTKQLQKNELGVLTIGTEMLPFAIFLPPQMEKIGVNGYCSKNCISKYLTNTNITVISATSHTHLTGKEVWTKIIRNGEDIGYLFRNKNYDFNYQQSFLLKPEVTITKDDQLLTYCGYQTINKTTITHVGQSTRQEMCYQFMFYYPRSANLAYCCSSPDYTEAVKLLQSLNDTGDINMANFNKSSYVATYTAMYEHFLGKQRTYSDNLKKKFIEFYNTSRFLSTCNGETDFEQAYEPIKPKNVYVEKDVCSRIIDNSDVNGTAYLNQSFFLSVLISIVLIAFKF